MIGMPSGAAAITSSLQDRPVRRGLLKEHELRPALPLGKIVSSACYDLPPTPGIKAESCHHII